MIRKASIGILVCAALLAAGCVSAPPLRERLDAIPAKHLSSYDFDPASPLTERIGNAPEELLDLYADAEGAPLSVHRLGASKRAEISAILGILPERHQKILQERLIGIYCVDGFAGSGVADYVLGPDDEIYAVVILHPRVFSMTAAELIEFRANSAFRRDDSDNQLEVNLSREVSALAYIILHETTHIVDYVERHTPYVEPGMLELFGRSARETPFTDEVWDDYRELRSSIDFPCQSDLRFYCVGDDLPLANRQMESVYRSLSTTPLASLYASFSWAEDFAEYVTFYYLVRVLGMRYEICVKRNGATVFSWEPMESRAVLRRAALIEPELFQSPDDRHAYSGASEFHVSRM